LTRNSVYIGVVLALVWVVLYGSVTVPIAAVGLVTAFLCVGMYRKTIIRSQKPDYSAIKLLAYPFLILFQAYMSAILVIKLTFFEVKTELVEIKTELSSPFLRVLLANAITLSPGSVVLDVKGDRISVLWLRKKIDGPHTICAENANKLLCGGMEKLLLKVQK
jgi:multicomponent Na+:H+ antiporter subunit E